MKPDAKLTISRLRSHAQLSRATVETKLSHLIGLLSLSQYVIAEGELIYCLSPPW